MSQDIHSLFKQEQEMNETENPSKEDPQQMKNEQGLSENVRNALCQHHSSWDKLCPRAGKGFAAEN